MQDTALRRFEGAPDRRRGTVVEEMETQQPPHPDREPRPIFVAADTDMARAAQLGLVARYGNASLADATVLVALGGDGFLLHTLHRYLDVDLPVFGMNCGSVGFLMNRFGADGLPARLAQAAAVTLHPLRMIAMEDGGLIQQALAFNEVSMLRHSHQAAKIRILVDDRERLAELACDGVLVSTPAGSTAYNLSVEGPILPLSSNLLALTPISAFRPRRWRGALIPNTAVLTFEVLEAAKRPVNAVADDTEVLEIRRVVVREDRSISRRVLFDPEMNLDERIIKEQFES